MSTRIAQLYDALLSAGSDAVKAGAVDWFYSLCLAFQLRAHFCKLCIALHGFAVAGVGHAKLCAAGVLWVGFEP